MLRFLRVLALICTPILRAQGQMAEYAVKFVCGVPDRAALAPGKYFTAINVHNPLAGATKLQFKVALTTPTFAPGPVTGFTPSIPLDADQALEIDCANVARRFGFGGRFVKGFVVIQSASELDIVAVYTAAQSLEGRVVALELERVPVRRTQK